MSWIDIGLKKIIFNIIIVILSIIILIIIITMSKVSGIIIREMQTMVSGS